MLVINFHLYQRLFFLFFRLAHLSPVICFRFLFLFSFVFLQLILIRFCSPFILYYFSFLHPSLFLFLFTGLFNFLPFILFCFCFSTSVLPFLFFSLLSFIVNFISLSSSLSFACLPSFLQNFPFFLCLLSPIPHVPSLSFPSRPFLLSLTFPSRHFSPSFSP